MQSIVRIGIIAVLLITAAVVWQGPTATEANGVAAVSAGGSHACALTTAGGVKCWGRNDFGQLGNGTTTDSSTAVDVAGLTGVAADISAGNYHTCALTMGGGVTCWGANYSGQLGNGTMTDSSTPVDVLGLTSGVAAISAGGYEDHTCAVTTAGGVKCWGANYRGQLGDGTTTNSSTAVDVTGLTSGVAAVSAGDYQTCALTTGGGVKCWGANFYGQLGDGQACGNDTCLAPVDATVLSGSVAAITVGGGHTCAITTAGGLKCWGGNANGELGDGQACGNGYCLAAVDVLGLTTGVAAVSASNTNTCAVTTGGGVKCWGYNGDGQLGNGTFSNSYTPVNVTGLTSGAALVSVGIFYACAVETGGGVKCWGWNDYGQLGNGMTTSSSTPVDLLIDSDGDGCIDAREFQTAPGSELSGGIRNPKDPWDYFNPTGDRQNRVDDILAVVDQYFDDDNDATPGQQPYVAGYNPDRDRTLVGPNAWNLGPPNGLQRVDDILNIVKQYFHDCA